MLRDLELYYKKFNFSSPMQNEYQPSIDENSQYFCESLQSQQDNLKQDKIEIIQPDLNFQTNQQINVACLSQSNPEKRPCQSKSQKGKKVKSKVQRSVFHNFQKHLVITLRQVIKIKNSSIKNQPQTVASQIWQIFLKQTRIFTKNILHVVFGVVDYQGSDMTNLYDEEMLKKFGFSDIFSQNSQSLVYQAQHYLRSQAVKQLNKINMKEFMKTRRIEHRQQFIEYVKQFVSQLQQGPIRKRLPKTNKIHMKLRNDIHHK